MKDETMNEDEIREEIQGDAAITVHPAAGPLIGAVRVPSDKSITHRALLFGALNNGRTIIRDPAPSADCRSTFLLLRTLGYAVKEKGDTWSIAGSMREAGAEELLLDCGNSGTTARLAAGFLTGEPGRFTLVGDASLSRRPMERVAVPLRAMGARITTTNGMLPMSVEGVSAPSGDHPSTFQVSSAQVHGALLLAGLRSHHGVILHRTKPMRDHTLRMAHAFGADVVTTDNGSGPVDEVRPSRIERDITVYVPGDVSSAAFIVTAAVMVPGSRVRVENVGLNPTRIAVLECLRRMGAHVAWHVEREDGEPVGTIEAEYSPEMTAIELDGDGMGDVAVAEMMDELPLLALLSSRAAGTTVVHGAGELRVKESDRISVTARMLRALGVDVTELEDGFSIHGPQQVRGGAAVDHAGDHRIAMVAALAALVAEEPVTIPEPDVVAVSYPQFWHHLRSLGVRTTTT